MNALQDGYAISVSPDRRLQVPQSAPLLAPDTLWARGPVASKKDLNVHPEDSPDRAAQQQTPRTGPCVSLAKKRPPPLHLSVPFSLHPGHTRDCCSPGGPHGGPRTDHETATPPLTPFPPWRGESEGNNVASLGTESEWSRDQDVDDWNDDIRRWGTALQKCSMLHDVMHGVFLVLQSVALLAVMSVLAGATVWKKTVSTEELWDWVWTYVQPSLAMLLLVCFTILLLHERRGIATLTMLVVQAGVLLMTTVITMAMTARVLEVDDRAIKGVVIGCAVFTWGVACMGFVRVVVVWRFREVRIMTRQGKRVYGTFKEAHSGGVAR